MTLIKFGSWNNDPDVHKQHITLMGERIAIITLERGANDIWGMRLLGAIREGSGGERDKIGPPVGFPADYDVDTVRSAAMATAAALLSDWLKGQVLEGLEEAKRS
ncbi:hypothetical protein FDA94_28745 [Herbidospora galbida]|uniref:Uncharacterized protein n=1 Tax=Herbidospora galbida TaxID=2575442 RepID=A0A4U3M7V3_9ACTN|nr:hypothetical protein [Herbidospora galbida]TKK84620.1 hypothetical protein FDA94_28745 [Herbidospora galbida]